jgi:hypothetical protein
MTHRYVSGCLRICHAEPGEVALDRSIELNFAGLNQLHHCQGSKRFCKRADKEGCLWRRAIPARADFAETAQVHNPVAFDDPERDARDVQAIHLLLNISVNGTKVRTLVNGSSRTGSSEELSSQSQASTNG